MNEFSSGPIEVSKQSLPGIEGITAEWLSQTLSAVGETVEVQALESEPVGSGQLGDTFRLHLRYAEGSSGPRSMICKLAARDEGSRAIASEWSLYHREIGFYQTLARRTSARTPLCHAALIDHAGRFVLLLEDLNDAQVGDQFEGLGESRARGAMHQVARLHADFWNCGEGEEFAWLESGRMAQPFYDASVLRSAWPGFRDRYADKMSAPMIEVCDRLVERYENYSASLERPRCVTHNDYRPDNMLFTRGDDQFTVDWQSAALGYNAVDVAYLIGGSYEPTARRVVERALLEEYISALRSSGVEDYSTAMLEEDYRHFAFAGINVAVGAAMMVKRTERGDAMFLTMLDRHVWHALDWDSMQILR